MESAETPAEYAAARETAIEAFTTAARLRWPARVVTGDDGSILRETDERPVDFAGLVAEVLASVAANIGGIDQLLAGRPGSWEAAAVRQLIEGTVGGDGFLLPGFRTEPVVVSLNPPTILQARGVDELWDEETEMTTLATIHNYSAGDVADGLADDDMDAARQRVAARRDEAYAAWAKQLALEVHKVAGELGYAPEVVEVIFDEAAEWDTESLEGQLVAKAADRIRLPLPR